ncbi:MAG TPA: branched-chain amino acid ABC transporter permease [Burkholderiales bacterium]|nr:branched-chain amino acid ABC transporter permease [Burkholderiales bacterium]
MTTQQLLAIAIDGLIYASWLFIIAVGLTLIYGVMKILNIAHGSLYALGAFTSVTFTSAWFAHGYPVMGSYAMLALAAVVVGLVAGPVIERGLLRFLYGKDEVVLVLVTYALFLILEDLIKLVWGVDPLFIQGPKGETPYALLGNFSIGSLNYPTYNLLLVGVAITTAIVLTWVLARTRAGKLLIAVIHDRETAAAMGIDVGRTYFVTFTLGAMLAAVGGALTAPTVSVVTGMGAEVIVIAFAVVVIGGLGSLPGAALGALIVGLVRAASIHLRPELELFAVYFVMAAVLIVRPKGLFSAAEVRRI